MLGKATHRHISLFGTLSLVLASLFPAATPVTLAIALPPRAAIAEGAAPPAAPSLSAPAVAAPQAATIWPAGHFGGWPARVTAPGGDVVYLGTGQGMVVVDVADPGRPQPLGSLQLLGGDVATIVVDGGIAYLTNGDVQIVDISDPAQPRPLASIDSGGRARHMAVADHIAYVADGDLGLQVIDVSDACAAVVLATLPTEAVRVAVAGGWAYVAGGSSLQIVDVSNPTMPRIMGSAPLSGGTRDLAVVGSIAYVLTAAGSLEIVDVSDPANPLPLGSYSTIGSAWDLDVAGGRAYIAAWSGGLSVVDVSNPALPSLLGTLDGVSDAAAVGVAGGCAYVLGTDGLYVVDVSNPAALQLLGVYASPIGALGLATAESGSTAYITVGGEFWVVDCANLTAPVTLGRLGLADAASQHGHDVAAGRAYVVEATSVEILDIVDGANPRALGRYAAPAGATVSSVAVAAGRAGVVGTTAGRGWLHIVDMSNPAAPVRLGVYDTPGDARRLALTGNTAYVADGAAGMRLIDISDPAQPVERGHLAPPSGAATAVLQVSGSLAFVAANGASEAWLQLVDVSDPTRPLLLDTFHLEAPVDEVQVAGADAFLAAGGIVWLRVRDGALQLMATYPLRNMLSLALLPAAEAHALGACSSFAGSLLGAFYSWGTGMFTAKEPDPAPQAPAGQEPNINADSGTPNQSDPVYLHSGELHLTEEDLHIPGRGVSTGMDYTFMRSYRSRSVTRSTLGWGWQHSYDRSLVADGSDILALTGPGRVDRYTSSDGTSFTSPPGFYTRLERDGCGGYALRERDGTVTSFRALDGSPAAGKMVAITDRTGNRLRFRYDARGRLATVLDTLGREIAYSYNAQGLLATVEDFAGRQVRLAYDAQGDLVTVTRPAVTGTPNGNDFPDGTTTRYTYSAGYGEAALNHNLLSVTAPNEVAAGGPPYLTNTYGDDPAAYDFDRVVRQEWGGTNASGIPAGGILTLAYEELNPGGDPADLMLPRSRTLVTDRAGNLMEYQHNVNGHRLLLRQYSNRDIRAADPDCFETRYEYNAHGELLRTILPEGNRLENTYDSQNPDRLQQGNLLEARKVPGAEGSGAVIVTSRFTYEPLFNQIRTVTDARGNDPSFLPPLGAWSAERYRTSYVYDYEEAALGDVNGDGRTDQAMGNLVRVLHPSVLLPSGSRQQVIFDYWYNDFGQLTRQIDPEGNVDEWEYHPENDPEGDGLELTARGGAQGGGYLRAFIRESAVCSRRTTEMAPLQIRHSYTYDRLGNRTGITDGRGVRTVYMYNQVNQLVAVRWAAEAPQGSGLATLDYEQYLSYDANGNLVRVDVENVGPQLDAERLPTGANEPDPANPFLTTTYAYDILDQMVSRRQEIDATAESVTGYRYDGNGNLVQTLYPTGRVDSTILDERNLPVRRTYGANDPAVAATVSYEYDGNGNLVRTVDARGAASEHVYDGYDRLSASLDAVGTMLRLQYDPVGTVVVRQSLQVQPGSSAREALAASNRSLPGPGVWPETLQPAQEVVLLSSERYLTDELNRLWRTDSDLFAVDPDTAVSTPLLTDGDGDGVVSKVTEYDALGRTVAQTDDRGSVTRWSYDGADRLVLRTDALGNTEALTYDANDNAILSVQTHRDAEGLVADHEESAWAIYDALDRPIRRTDAAGQTRRMLYDSRDNLVFESDAQGAPISDPLGLYPGPINDHGDTIRYAYNGLGLQTQTAPDQRRGGAWSDEITTDFLFDAGGRLVAVVDDNGHATAYGYDGRDRVITRTFADGTHQAFAYDANGNLTVLDDANGSRMLVAYDAMNRPIRVDVLRGAGVLGTTRQTFAYDALGRVVEASDNNDPEDQGDDSLVTRLYDSLGRPIQESQNGQVVAAVYDGAGNRLSLSYPGGRLIRLSADALGRVDTITEGGSQALIADFDYLGPLHSVRQRNGNGTQLDLAYDPVWRPTEVSHSRESDGQLLAGFAYGYDRAHNRLYESRLHESGQGDAYGYDSLHRLLQATNGLADPSLPATGGTGQTAYNLDGLGNRLSVTVDGRTITYETNAINAYTRIGGKAQASDANGNLAADGSRTFAYDFANRLVAVAVPLPQRVAYLPLVQGGSTDVAVTAEQTAGASFVPAAAPTIRFAYDALGRRVARITPSGTTRYIYDGWQVIEEQGADGTTQASYVYGRSVNELLTMQRGAETYTAHTNALGSIVALSDASGAVVERYAYDPYGAPLMIGSDDQILEDSAVGNPYLFAGQRYDPGAGLYDYRRRDYDPGRGRYLQRDPLGAVDGLNLYAYAGDNPVSFSDPTGTSKVPSWAQYGLGRPPEESGSVWYYSPSSNQVNAYSKEQLGTYGQEALEMMYGQNQQALAAAQASGDQAAEANLIQQMQTLREVMAEEGYKPLGAYGQPGSEPMTGWQQVGEFFGVLGDELQIWNWGEWENNPLLISETYGGWMNDAAWGSAYVAAGAALLAGGLITLEAMNVTAIGSAPLWGGGATPVALGADPIFPGLSTSIAGEVGALAAPSPTVVAAYNYYNSLVATLLPLFNASAGSYSMGNPNGHYYLNQFFNVIAAAVKAKYGLVAGPG